MAPSPVRAGVTAGALLVLGLLGWCSQQARAQEREPTHVLVVYNLQRPAILVPVAFAQAGAWPVLMCESSGRPEAHNGDQVGLFQISERFHAHRFWRRGWSWLDATDPQANATIASELFAEQGLVPWQASSLCWDRP